MTNFCDWLPKNLGKGTKGRVFPLHCLFQDKLDNETDNLSQAKDRAQLTATTAMSTVHVALLKAILDQGPESNNYYTISIVLIVLSLILQVFAGLLSLLISKIRSFYTKHRYVHKIYDYVTCKFSSKIIVTGSQGVTCLCRLSECWQK